MLKSKKWLRVAAALGLAVSVVCAEPFGALAVKAEEVSLAAEGNVGINLSVTYGQTEGRRIFDMINEMRTSETDAWYWNEDNTEKVSAGALSPLVYDYDLEQAAMKRAAEIALSFSHTRPNGERCFTVYPVQNFLAKGENIAAGQSSAAAANSAWREDNEPYNGQGHRRNMLNAAFNCVGIGHVYSNGRHYWVEEFGYKSELNTTDPGANDTEQMVVIDALSSGITGVSGTFDKRSYELKTGETVTVTVTPTLQYTGHWGNGVVVTDTPTITVSDSTIAQISGNTITALKEGTTELQISLYGITGTANATVIVSDTVAATDVTLNQTKLTLTAGEKATLSTTITPSNAKTDLKWSSSNLNVARVDQSGAVTAVGEGSATITVKDSSNSKVSASCTVTVKKKEVTATSVKLNKTKLELTAGEKATLSATITPSNAKTDLKWSSSNLNVARVDQSGAVTAVGEGSATITVKDSSNSKISASCQITVIKKEAEKKEEKQEPEENTTDNEIPVPAEKGTILTTDDATHYKVTGSSAERPTVAYMKAANASGSITIPATVTIDDVTYRVTAISAKAFANNKKITKVTIGRNIKTIGKKTFSGCKNLKTITIKSINLTSKSVGSKAFSGISKKATIKVPKTKYAAYQKLIKAKGAAKTVKYKKI